VCFLLLQKSIDEMTQPGQQGLAYGPGKAVVTRVMFFIGLAPVQVQSPVGVLQHERLSQATIFEKFREILAAGSSVSICGTFFYRY
jgi:hypothetical protein